MSSYEVRETRQDDIDAVTSLTKDSWARTYDPFIGVAARKEISDTKHVPALFAGEIGTDDAVTLVAALPDGTLIGHAGGRMDGKGGCFVDRLHIVSEWKGKGVAQALMDLFEQTCAGRAGYLELTVLDGNERAIRFYRRYGFEPVGPSTVEQGLAGIPAQRLRKVLTASADA